MRPKTVVDYQLKLNYLLNSGVAIAIYFRTSFADVACCRLNDVWMEGFLPSKIA